MLVARRDPPFESGAHDVSHAHGYHPRHGSRVISALQIVGTLVGIPVGLASIYSVYQTNFTVEARCESLRANIVGLLDKSADATTLHMLARRDVANFENTCGTVDPDAVAAFKHLLAVKTAVPAAPPQAAQEPLKKAAVAAKPAPVVKPAVAEAKLVRPEAKAVEAKPPEPKPSEAKAGESPTSDENWVASVREALTHAPARDAAEAAAPPRALGTLPVTSAPPVAAASAPAAPALPAPVPVAAAPEPAADHPVPPGEIPDAPPAETSHHSWMSKVPILNRVVGD